VPTLYEWAGGREAIERMIGCFYDRVEGDDLLSPLCAVLLERSAYDQDGNYQSATFMDYLLPTACDISRIEIEHLETVPLDADVNFRGVGQGGMIVAPPTVVSAIEDALAPFGVRIYEQHLPPSRILELIAQQAGDDADNPVALAERRV
jgi:hypothetical protein